MVNDSVYRNSSVSNNDSSKHNVVPPWCYSARRRRLRDHVNCSSYSQRENIEESLHDDKENNRVAHNETETTINNCKQLQYKHKSCGRNFLKLLIFLLLTSGFIYAFWDKFPSEKLIAKYIPKTSIMNFLNVNVNHSTSSEAECSHRTRHLAAELSRAQQALRNTLQHRRNLMFNTYSCIPEFSCGNSVQRRYVGVKRASIGRNTKEWVNWIVVWGITTPFRSSSPPDTVLALRPPTLGDCWAFSGSHGELIIELAYEARPNYISVEHLRPDTARSAPKNFVVYSILENNTWVETTRSAYVYYKPAKQYFTLTDIGLNVKHVAFRVLSNQGNEKFTCIYRIKLLENV